MTNTLPSVNILDMEISRPAENRIRNWTGTVHYAANGQVACGPVKTSAAYMEFTTATVTCARCIAQFGEDEAGHHHIATTYHADEHAARRAAERAARREGHPV